MPLASKGLFRYSKQTLIKELFKYSEKVAIFFLGVATFFLALSPWISRHALILAVVFSVFAGNWNSAWYVIRSLRFIQWSIGLIALLAISLCYTIAGVKYGLQALFHYTKLLYIPFLIPLFHSEKVRKCVIYCLISTAVFASISILLIHLEIFSASFFEYSSVLFSKQVDGYFINPIPASVILAFAFYFSLDFFLKKKAKLYHLLTATFLFFTLFMINAERTGCCIAIILLGFLVWKNFIARKRYITAIFCIATIPLLSYQLPAFQYRVKDFVTNFSTRHASQDTSIGLRIQFALNSFKIIREQPWLGVGAGGFLKAYQATGGKRLDMAPLNDPHNSYLLIAVQLGLIGLAFYLVILLSVWLEIKKLCTDSEAQSFVRAILAALIFNGFTDITITCTPFGNLYVILFSCFFAIFLRNKHETCAGVALLHTDFRLKGGMESYLRDLILGFSKAGNALTLCVNKVDPVMLDSLPGLKVRRFRWRFLPRVLKKFAFYLSCDKANLLQDHKLVISLVKTRRKDILICGGVHKTYLLIKKSYRFLHDYLELYFERRAFESAPIIIANSQSIKNEILTHYNVDPNKVKVLYPPINSHRFSYKTRNEKHQLRVKMGFKEDDYIVLFISSNHVRKGFYPLVEAFKRLEINFRCLIIGEKPSIVLPDNMQWLGFIEKTQDYYALADVTILPSFYEPFGITVVESLECGTPVIISAHVGVSELLEKEDGIVLNSVTPDSIYNALKAIKQGNYKPEKDFGLRKGLTIDQHIQALSRFARISNTYSEGLVEESELLDNTTS